MPPAPRADAARVAALRDDLEGSAWTVDAVNDLLGPVAAAALLRESAAPARRALADPSVRAHPVAALTSLFVLGQEVPRAHVEAALPRLRVEGALALGLVEAAGGARGDAVRALVDLRPHALELPGGHGDSSDPDGAGGRGTKATGGPWWIASDLGEVARGGALATDHVLGVGGASTTLAQLTPRTPVGRLLDVGTGSGVQALLAAGHAASLVATDTSARALAFAAFNAALAGVEVELRRGSLLEPVTGERFDQVVSNPPFVVTPRSAAVPGWEYRDGGLVGDEVVRRLVTGVAGVLAPAGTAVLLGNWEHRAGEGWRDRVGGWLEESGLDGWVVQREVADPAEYAETWIRDGGQQPGPAFDALLGAWLDDFDARGVQAVGFGFLVLQAPPASAAGRPRWRRVEEATGALRPGLGEHVAAVLAARELLAATDDAGLLAEHLVVADDVTEERHARPGAGAPQVLLLRQGGGLSRAVEVDAALAGVVGACDGEVALGPLARAVAALLDVDEGALVAQLLPQVRELLADGLLRAAA